MARCIPVFYWLLLVMLATQELTAINQGRLIRIPLETNDQLRFTGAVRFGSPPRSVLTRVVFDTGSSDTWVTSVFAIDLNKRRAQKSFAIGYGSGIVSGLAALADLKLGSEPDEFLLHDVPIGFVDDQTSVIPELEAQGIVGLGMEALAQIHSNLSIMGLLVEQRDSTNPLVFSLFISRWSGAEPASQLILGGNDPALSTSNTTWFSFPVVSTGAFHGLQHSSQSGSTKDSYGFWALRVHNLSFGNEALPLGNFKSHKSAALLDSGTSMILLPPHTFDSIVHALSVRFGTRLLTSQEKQTLPVCRPCQVDEFPPLAFDFIMGDDENLEANATSQRFELQGSDYVRCDQRSRECTAMLAPIHPSEITDHLDILILGTVFFRAYYARFDYSNKQVGLACTLDDNGVCLGGLQSALDYHGQPYEPFSEVQLPHRSWAGLCAAVTAIALLTGLRTLLQPYEKTVPSSSSRT